MEVLGGTLTTVVIVFVMGQQRPLVFLGLTLLSSTGAAPASPPRRRMADENNGKASVRCILGEWSSEINSADG